MKLRNEFEVAVPVERTWETLLDVPRVAHALPGATMEPEGEGGAWRGTMKVKLGPVTTEYAGTARIQDADEDDRVASYRVEGREARGQGSAAATITARLAAVDGATRVVVETDMQVTGRQAQLGRGLMEQVASAILDDFAGRLERELRGEAAPRDRDGRALDVGAAVRGPLLERAGLVVLGLVAGLALGRVVWRR
jgi:carbon monoxide dehydrogenase subunit G